MTGDVHAAATRVLEACKRQGLMVATAESCTGGLVAGALTAIAGSSAVVERGFVTYSNQAKAEMLGVPMALIEAHGAVSEPVARAMAEGALPRSRAQLSVAITGIAGPDGGGSDKPVGLVHFAAARQGAATVARHHVFVGDREAVRVQSVLEALALLAELAG
ncbi:MAG: CinA family protein [Magnetospirillum sp.]|nr:CinA family protein [Magnetospirillum sp.]